MQKYRRGRRTKKLGIAIRVLLFLAAAVTVLVIADKRLRPIIITMSQYQCRVSGSLAMSEAVLEVLNSDTTAETIIKTEKNSGGEITNIYIDAGKLNRLKTRLSQAVAQRLSALEYSDISVPLGTLLGWQLMAGRGPNIRLRIVPASYVEAEITDRLETAGINQTKYGIFITFRVTMSAILPGYSTSATAEDEVCIAQTLIVGDVPQVYAVNDK